MVKGGNVATPAKTRSNTMSNKAEATAAPVLAEVMAKPQLPEAAIVQPDGAVAPTRQTAAATSSVLVMWNPESSYKPGAKTALNNRQSYANVRALLSDEVALPLNYVYGMLQWLPLQAEGNGMPHGNYVTYLMRNGHIVEAPAGTETPEHFPVLDCNVELD